VNIDVDGYLHLEPDHERHTYLPSINALMEEVAARFGPNSGAIVFSGMGDDGAAGSLAIMQAGGTVWVQDPASCAIDSMPNAVRAVGASSGSGSPERLAQSIVSHLKQLAEQAGN
jgi:chemosensory pili system protein ChpB (putative protein-glutamate methylesterase)